jgi:hypothetical protein
MFLMRHKLVAAIESHKGFKTDHNKYETTFRHKRFFPAENQAFVFFITVVVYRFASL